MEKLAMPLSLLRKALKSLELAFEVIKDAQRIGNPNLILAAEDSIIQRFEYSYDSFWKFFKNYLEIIYDEQNVNSPKKVFRDCVSKRLFTEKEGSTLIDMADDRNVTCHNYDIERVRLILPNIPKYYSLMAAIIDRIVKNKEFSKPDYLK
jgi:nucleotidyltransferase substrate binding protein (TIGR01987 family)